MVNFNYLYNPDAAKPFLEKKYLLDEKLGFKIIERGTIIPHKIISGRGIFNAFGGIVDSKGEFIKSSLFAETPYSNSYTPSGESILYSSETVVYLGGFTPSWGHSLTDHIRFMWFLKSDYFKVLFKNCPLVYLNQMRSSLIRRRDFARLLEILEIDVNKLREIKQPTQFEYIIMPDASFKSPVNKIAGFTNEYRDVIDRVRSFGLKHSTSTSKKIYFFNGKKSQIGEERIAEYFKSKGYVIINPEKQNLTFDEELSLLVNCESFAAISGSSAINSIFLRDRTEVILIPRIASHVDHTLQACTQVHPLNVNYIDSTLSIFSPNIILGFWLYIVGEQLKNFFGDKWEGYEEEDFKNFLQYVKNSLNSGRKLNPTAHKYSASILLDFMEQLKRREDLIMAYNMPPDWETFEPSILKWLCYQAHVDRIGWGDGWKSENQPSNALDQKLFIQAIKINFPNHRLYYSVYYNKTEGWSEEVLAPKQAGTTGEGKPIFGIRIRFNEAGAKEYDILYRVHKFDDTWTPWVKNGETLYSYGVKLNAIQIKLEPKSNVTKV